MKSLQVRIEKVVYGGLGIARIPDEPDASRSSVAFVPYTLPGELIDAERSAGANELRALRIVESSSKRVQPACPHFGTCGGCHLQMASYGEQLRLKTAVLRESLARAGVGDVPEITSHAGEPWHYRNRIRLHVTRSDSRLRLGYRERESREVLPITTCPIAADLLWNAAEALLALAERDADMRRWLTAAAEVELFCDAEMSQLQTTLLCSGTSFPATESFHRAMAMLQREVSQLAGAGALRVHSRTGQPQQEIAKWGADGLNYEVAGERYWVTRGGFFQVNRFLLPTMLDLVCSNRSGQIAWDLFAGVGLFARVLARQFHQVTAVEANPAAARELNSALQRLGSRHRGITAVIDDFLRDAAVQRERPDLVVLDPPRAGAGVEACDLLVRIAPPQVVYVSCDPVTLGRDLAVLQRGYEIEALHLVDLFPQTYHQEAVVQLRRRS
jgi:23S rRNA (uracil1939-C5)-methyltransferase